MTEAAAVLIGLSVYVLALSAVITQWQTAIDRREHAKQMDLMERMRATQAEAVRIQQENVTKAEEHNALHRRLDAASRLEHDRVISGGRIS